MVDSHLPPNITHAPADCRELVSVEDWEMGWDALRTLRPGLEKSDFISRKPELQRGGYHLVGIFLESRVMSVASYTISPHPVLLREMIIHDMSTLAGHEGRGFASQLLNYLDMVAVQQCCGRTFVASAKAAEFYQKNGYQIHATALKKAHNVDRR